LNVVPLAAVTARDFFRVALDIEVESADALAATAVSADERLAWAEHGNRLHVFRLFQYADHALAHAASDGVEDRLEAARGLDPFERVWVTEGIGYASRRAPADAAWLPPESLVPLHAGAGLAIASRWLRHAGDLDTAAIVAGVAGECRRASVGGFERVAFEALGLAVRTLAPQLVPWFDSALAARPAVDRACFWHGVGRGSYFAISNWQRVDVPAARVIASIRKQAPAAIAERNAIAGFTWAVTLVNLRSPEVIEGYVSALSGVCDGAAQANGLEAALIVWQHAAPDDDSVERLLAYSPGARAASLEWNRMVPEAILSARRRWRAVVSEGRLQDVFCLT
jgi:hypothetical protein